MKAITALALASISTFVLAQDKLVLPEKAPKEGEEVVFQLEIKFQAMGQDASFSGQAHQLITKVESDGSYTADSWIENGKISIMGSDQEQPDDRKSKKFDKTGKPLVKEDFESGITEVLAVFANVKFPKEGAVANQKWKLVDWFDRIGEGNATFVESSDYLGKKAAQIKIEYAPKAGGSSNGTTYISAETGEFVGLSLSFSKIDVAPGIQSDGTIVMKRIEK